MIQAGTIRIGSGRTCSVVRGILDQFDQAIAVDHFPGVTATSWPGRKVSAPTSCRPLALRCQSFSQ